MFIQFKTEKQLKNNFSYPTINGKCEELRNRRKISNSVFDEKENDEVEN